MCSMLGLFGCIDGEARRNKELGDAYISLDFSIQLKDITVRIIHAGGREEHYQNAIPASKLMKKYPGMCVARPEVFKIPNESILMPEEQLFPGQKYYIIPCTTVQKLKRKQEKGKLKDSDVGNEAKLDQNGDGDWSEESVCSAKDYYVSKERWSRCFLKKGQKENKMFVPPIQKPRLYRENEWEPSLTSIQELSP